LTACGGAGGLGDTSSSGGGGSGTGGGGGGGYGGGGAGTYGGGVGPDSDGGGGGGGSTGPTGSSFTSGSNSGAATTAGSSGRILISYSSSVSHTAPSWYQSAGRDAGASCDAGWSPSWAQWPNSNTGGFVCNREIYMTTSGTWSSRSQAATTFAPGGITPKPVVIIRGC
jgi:hypothetical protein